MKQISRRTPLQTAGCMTVGAVAGCVTPENVGPVVRGDLMQSHIDGLPNLSVKIGSKGWNAIAMKGSAQEIRRPSCSRGIAC